MTRVAHPQFSFADIEFLTQGIDLDPILKRVSEFLDDHPKTIKRVRKDLALGRNEIAVGTKPPNFTLLEECFVAMDRNIRRIPIIRKGRIMRHFYLIRCYAYLG